MNTPSDGYLYRYALLKLDTSGTGKVSYEDFMEVLHHIYQPIWSWCAHWVSQKFWSTDERWDGLRLEDEELMELLEQGARGA